MPATLTTEPTTIFERMTVLGDPVRCRLLLLLERQELTVSELCAVLQLPQSTASRHLKLLTDDGWITARRDGTSRRYSVRPEFKNHYAHDLWQLVRGEVAAGPAARQDFQRLPAVLGQRRTRSREFFSSAAGRWAELRRDLFGSRFDLEGLLGLVEENWVVGDLGCGTGLTSLSLAPFVDQVIAVDESEAMLDTARERLAALTNVEVRQARLEVLPLDNGSLDAAILTLVLHHQSEPLAVLREVARTLKAGGKVLVVDMLAHQREEYRQEMGHVWLGFDKSELTAWLEQAGFERIRFCSLPADPEAKGPALFTASARKRTT